MNTIEIFHRWNSRLLFSHTAEGATMREAVLAAIASEANLSEANLSKADLSEANLSFADLSKADLSKANLSFADLSKANLSFADLSKANLPGSLRSLLAVPDLDKHLLAAIEAGEGKLEMSQWHSDECGTTHCRAGWAVVLAGAAGKTAESLVGTCAAGALIYEASYPGQRVPNFYHMDSAYVLADIRQRAETTSSAEA